MNRRSFFGAMLLCLLITVFVTGCGWIELYQNQSERDANEMFVLLSGSGIKVNKKKEIRQNEVSFTIEVREVDRARSLDILGKHNLPRPKADGFKEVYPNVGLIPTPDEQKARFIMALTGEITNALMSIPQVVSANVVLNIPTANEFDSAETKHNKRPTASVTVRIRPDLAGLTSVTESKIQQFVANAVEGMNPRDVTVMMDYMAVEDKALMPGDVRTMTPQLPGFGGQPVVQPAVEHKLIGLKLDAESKDRLKVYLLFFFLLLVALACSLIVVIVQGSRVRREFEALKGPAGRQKALEGQVLDEEPPQIPQPPMS